MKTEIRDTAKNMVIEAMTALRRPLGEKRFQQAVRGSEGALKIVVGGGSHSHQGWLHTDLHWRSPVYLDLMKPWPIPTSCTITHIFADNVIEHFRLPAGRVVLRHMFDALAPGGVVRLATPDVGRLSRAYLDDPALAQEHLEWVKDAGYDVYHPVDLLRVTFAESGHYLGYCYDFEALAQELKSAGFSDVRREEIGQSSDPELRNLEHRNSKTEVATSLVMEARK